MEKITQEKLNSWYEHKSNKGRFIEAQEDTCLDCDGLGYVTIQTGPDSEHTRQCVCSLQEEL